MKQDSYRIYDHPFNKDEAEALKGKVYGENWPVVYLLNNNNEMYVGESSNVYVRAKQHLSNEERLALKEMHVIYD
ncbi:GIY-YIG nuclease family protein, partial [uncultured Dubosiella sp.]